jgi:hypothetical protein
VDYIYFDLHQRSEAARREGVVARRLKRDVTIHNPAGRMTMVRVQGNEE